MLLRGIFFFLDFLLIRRGIETIFSQIKAKRERLRPIERTKKAPVKFFRERRDSLSLSGVLDPLSIFPLHWGGIGRNFFSQYSINPACLNSNSLDMSKMLGLR